MAVCEVCSKSIRAKEDHGYLILGKPGGHHICDDCLAGINALKKGGSSASLQKYVNLMSSYLNKRYIQGDMAEYIKRLVANADTKIETAKKGEEERKAIEEKRRKYAAQEYERKANFKTTTGYQLKDIKLWIISKSSAGRSSSAAGP